MKLFEEYPYIEDERIVLKKMTLDDADALAEFAGNEKVYRYLPTFLYEQKYEDAVKALAKMEEECFDTGESIIMGIYYKPENCRMIGIAEIYNYEETKAKASIGCRISDAWWGRGIATDVIKLLRDYLFTTDVKTITAHIMTQNKASAGAAKKNGFLCKYPNTYGDWGFSELTNADKYVFKKEWLSGEGLTVDETGAQQLKQVSVEQFVMAYEADHDRIRAILPDGYESLRPVLRINAEIRDNNVVYIEFNTPVAADGRRGWLNLANWKSTRDEITFERLADGAVTIRPLPLDITFKGTGKEGGCPAENDNDGCYYLKYEDGILRDTEFRPAEKIDANKEYCDCSFEWHTTDIPAALIPCKCILGAYKVSFQRYPN